MPAEITVITMPGVAVTESAGGPCDFAHLGGIAWQGRACREKRGRRVPPFHDQFLTLAIPVHAVPPELVQLALATASRLCLRVCRAVFGTEPPMT